MEKIEYSYQILGKGLLGLWGTIGVTVVVLAVMLAVLRGDLRKVRNLRLRSVLIATKAAILLLLGWLLLGPALYVKQTITRPDRLILVVDDSQSMAIRDEPEGASGLLDTVELIQARLAEGRLVGARDLSRLLEKQAANVEVGAKAVQEIVDCVEDGLPWGESFGGRLRSLSSQCSANSRTLQEAIARFRADTARLAALRMPSDESRAVALCGERVAALGESSRKLADELARLSAEKEVSIDELRALRELLLATLGEVRAAAPEVGAIRDALDAAFLASRDPAVRKQIEESGRVSRLELVKRFLVASPDVAELRKERRVSVLSMSSGTECRPESLVASCQATDFLPPLRTVLDEFAREVVGGVVLFSDGRQNASTDVMPALEVLKGKGIPVCTVAVGSPVPPADLAVADYRLPLMLQKGRKTAVSVTVKTGVPRGTPFRVRLRSGERVLGEVAAQATGTAEQRVNIPVSLDSVGTVPVEIAVAADGAADRFPANDSVTDCVRVLDKTAKCLLVADVPNWDVQYLLQAMSGLPVKVDVVFTGALPKGPPRGSGKDKVPGAASQWAAFDLAILAGEPFAGFGESDADALREAVVKNGLGVLILPDVHRGQGYGGALAKAFGWDRRTLDSGRRRPDSDAEGVERLAFGPRPDSVPVLPPCALRPHPLASLAVWRSLPPPQELGFVAEQDIVLMRTVAGAPLLSYGVYGKGRCVELGVGDVYRMNEFEGWPEVMRFLEGLVALALTSPFEAESAQGAIEEARIGLLPRVPVAGEQATVFVAAGREQGDSVSWTQDGKTGLARTRRGPGGVSSATVTFPSASPALIEAAGVELRIAVRRPLSAEEIEFSTDEECLREIAGATGGRFVHLAEFGELKQAVPVRQQVEVHVAEHSLWHHWWLLLALVAGITTEYVVRRKAGMVL